MVKTSRFFLLLTLILRLGCSAFAQDFNPLERFSDTAIRGEELSDSLLHARRVEEQLERYRAEILAFQRKRREDSLLRATLEDSLANLKATDQKKRDGIIERLETLERESDYMTEEQRQRVESLRASSIGYPVFGPLNDTLFLFYERLGAFTPAARAGIVTERMREAYRKEVISTDTIAIESFGSYWNIRYGELVISTVTINDALWSGTAPEQLAEKHAGVIDASLHRAKEENSVARWLLRIGATLLAIAGTVLLVYLLNRLYRLAERKIADDRRHLLGDLTYKNYTVLSERQKKTSLRKLCNFLRWAAILITLYLLIPVILSIFPFTRGWSDRLFDLILSPFSRLFRAVWSYLPNVFTIATILFVIHYVVKFLRYFFREIASGRLRIKGFYTDLAKPTFSILKTLTYLFAIVLIFPYLPGSNSPVFQGVSVFLGLLISLGSTSAIGNIVAGLVITYMRPFQVGDRIKIGDTLGDVVEKGLLVTRVKSVTNEIVTIPNSSVLSQKTLNYTTDSINQKAPLPGERIIVWVTVSVGYDVPWRRVYDMLLNAAERNGLILTEPAPFILQMELHDFYAVYQLNVYTDDAKKSLAIRSSLYENIQDAAAEHGIDLTSPHLYAESRQSPKQP